MRIGTMFLGRVDALDHESIQTKFLIVGVPIAPIASYFATSEQASGVTGFEIPLNVKSVLAGYARLGLGLAAFLFGLFGYIEHRPWHGAEHYFVLAGACAALWLLSMFFLGRLSERERQRRAYLRTATGVGIPPELLGEDMKDALARDLARRASAAGVLSSDWKARVDRADARPSELPFLLAFAEYDGDAERAASVRRQLGI